MAWILGAVAALLVTAVGLLTLAVYQSVRPVRWGLAVSPGDFGIAYEDVTVPSRDGTKLAGWWVPAAGARGTVILCHGYPANRSDVNPLIPFLNRGGYNVLAFDFRRLGESEGDICTIGAREPEDLHGAVAYAQSRSHEAIGVLGISMGAAVSLMAAAANPDIRAVVADSAYRSLDVQVPRRFGSNRVAGAYASWLGRRILGCPLSDASPLRAMPTLAPRPVLLIHGTADRVIPPADSEALYAAATGPKDIWLAPDSHHVQAHADHPAEYERRVLAFFDGALQP